MRIVGRREWGATTTIGAGRRVPLSSRRFFVVHWPGGHVAGERDMVRAIERQHRNQGWGAAPGYNFLIGNSGTIFEGCGRDVRGVHSPPRNTDGFGVCILQPINGRATDAALRATRQLYDHLSGLAGRRLTPSWHGQHWATACAGQQLNAWVRSGMFAPGGGAGATIARPTLRPGARGDDVRRAQRLLNNFGRRVAVDGVYGPATVAAVQRQYRAFGHQAQTHLGPNGWRSLEGNHPWSVLLPGERGWAAELEARRRTARRHGGWGNVDPVHLQTARTMKSRLVEQRKAVWRAAQAPNGWNVLHRRERWRILRDLTQ